MHALTWQCRNDLTRLLSQLVSCRHVDAIGVTHQSCQPFRQAPRTYQQSCDTSPCDQTATSELQRTQPSVIVTFQHDTHRLEAWQFTLHMHWQIVELSAQVRPERIEDARGEAALFLRHEPLIER